VDFFRLAIVAFSICGAVANPVCDKSFSDPAFSDPACTPINQCMFDAFFCDGWRVICDTAKSKAQRFIIFDFKNIDYRIFYIDVQFFIII
jgi:hypothetical protein